MTILFAWAVPVFPNGFPWDHTWVTSYDNRLTPYPNQAAVVRAGVNYWYCWGSFYRKGGTPANEVGFLGSASGDLGRAFCLVAPNADPQKDPAGAGTIFHYGLDGVCHQLANQVLYATGGSGSALTVKQAGGYRVSTFIYGTFGARQAEWASRRRMCSGPMAEGVRKMAEMPDDFETAAAAILGDDPELLSRLLALTSDVREANTRVAKTFVRPSADELNARNQAQLDRAASLLGPDRFESLFGFPPGERINLVRPDLGP